MTKKKKGDRRKSVKKKTLINSIKLFTVRLS